MKIGKLLTGAALAAILMPTNMALASTIVIGGPSLPLAFTVAAATSTTPNPGGPGDIGTEVENQAVGIQVEQPVSATDSSPGGFGTASASAANQIELQTAVAGSGTVALQNDGGAQSGLDYYIEVTGPTDHAPVPLDVTANLLTSASGGVAGTSAGTQSDLTLFDDAFGGNTQIAFYSSCTEVGGLPCPGGSTPGALAINSVVMVSANDLFFVEEFVDGVADGPGTASSGTADPFFQIDPGFLAQNPGYQLLVSDGVGNSPLSAVPEPATWALMIFGIGVIGAAKRRQRRKPIGSIATA